MKKTLLAFPLAVLLLTTPMWTWAENVVETIELETIEVVISQHDNILRVVGANGQNAKIYDLAGVCVMAFKVEGSDYQHVLNLRKGCYIVKIGTTARKIFVK